VNADRAHLTYIVECIADIEDILSTGRQAVETNRHTRAALLYYLQTMSESTQKLSPALKQEHPELDWTAISGFRNRLVHGYLSVNMSVVWRVVTLEVPQLKAVAKALLEAHFGTESDSER
jgi:uncharacterized protein with HEPN domain